MGTLDQGQDSLQLLSGHVVWKSQGMVSTQVPTEEAKLAISLPTNQPCPWNLDGVPEHPLVPGFPFRGFRVL